MFAAYGKRGRRKRQAGLRQEDVSLVVSASTELDGTRTFDVLQSLSCIVVVRLLSHSLIKSLSFLSPVYREGRATK